MEENKVDYFKPHHLLFFDGVNKFKSIWRAIRRGKVSTTGLVYPSRPFSNRKPTKGRKINERKKHIYGQLKQRGL